MRPYAGISLGLGLGLAAQVSSFAFVPLAVRPGTRGVSNVILHRINARVRQRGLSMQSEGGELEEALGQLEVTPEASARDVALPRGGAGAMGGVLGDVISEVARRPATSEEEDDDEDILPMNAGLEPMAPGPIVPKPIKGMDADDVPGKIVLDPETLSEQQKGLEKIAQQLRRERLDQEAIDNVVFGFCPTAELWNGRSAMFGITVGMLTELWTGQSLPQQVETMAQIIGLLPLDYETYFQ